MKRLQSLVLTLGILLGVAAAGLATVQPVGAINVFKPCNGSNSAVCREARGGQANSLVQDLVNLLFFAIGVIAVIMIIIGGIRYTTSDGDSSKVKSAKDTVLYSVVGLVVALLAYAIVTFVVGRFS